MAVFDRLFGTRQPAVGVVAVDAAQLRYRLLGLNDPGEPWSVRDGGPERVDLVAEWVLDIPGWEYRHLTILMRLDPARHEVRTVDRQRKSGQIGGTEYQQGNINERSSTWTLERDENGKRHWVKEAQFDTRPLKNLLRDTVTSAGWTWKGGMRRP